MVDELSFAFSVLICPAPVPIPAFNLFNMDSVLIREVPDEVLDSHAVDAGNRGGGGPYPIVSL